MIVGVKNMRDFDLEQYESIDIRKLPKNAYYHYTNINNLDSILNNGLIPAIGDNAVGIEKSEKIFFTIGTTNSLVLMESWLRWLIAKSLSDMPGEKLDKPVYKLATNLLKIKMLQPLLTFVVKCEFKSKKIRLKEYKNLKNILDNSVYLSLDLEYFSDYSLNDIDEVKNGNFDKKLLELMYNNSNVNDEYMEYWNMHTYSDKQIEPEKIHLLKIGDSYCASDILEYMRKNTEIKIKRDLPFLYGYFKWLKTLEEK